MLTDSASTAELLLITFIAALFVVALVAILVEERQEADYYKTWEQDK